MRLLLLLIRFPLLTLARLEAVGEAVEAGLSYPQRAVQRTEVNISGPGDQLGEVDKPEDDEMVKCI